MNSLLSICIPTYNRSSVLGEGLDKLIPLAAYYDIPIVVSDNASDDNTESVVAQAKARYPLIFYYRNPENLGMDKNFELALQRAPTEYAWLLGDDDRLTSWALDVVVSALKMEPCDLLLLNGGSSNHRGGRVTTKYAASFSNPQELLRELGWHTTWISSLVISKKLISAMDFSRFIGSYFSHVGSLFDALSRMPVVKIQWISSSCFYPSAMAKFSWSSRVLEIFAQKWAETISSLPDYYTEDIKRECILSHSRYTKIFSVVGLLNLRAQDSINRSNVAYYKGSLRKTTTVHPLLVMLISSIPVAPLKALRYFYIKARNFK